MVNERSRSVLDAEWVPRCSVARGLAASAGALFGGPLLGIGLASLVAPGSNAAGLASFFAFGGAFVLGMLSWLGLGVAAVLLAALRELVRGRLPEAPPDAAARVVVPPGHVAFVVWAPLLATLAGCVAGVASRGHFLATVALYAAGGLAYGVALRALARRGYLPFPEPG